MLFVHLKGWGWGKIIFLLLFIFIYIIYMSTIPYHHIYIFFVPTTAP